jgi:CMP-N,N'-diacetyllegionaminic acid synthase
MYKNKKIVALIPARGGSKGLARKNVKLLLGKPLIAWTIEASKKSKYLDRIIVSTEDNQIARVAKDNGAEIPFIRPKKFARDDSPMSDVIVHAIQWLKKRKQQFNYLALLQPTSPLREAADIDRCIERLINSTMAKSIVSLAKFEEKHPEFNVIIDKKTGLIKRLDGSTVFFENIRRQDLSDVYFFTGSMYISEVKTYMAKKTFFHDATLAYIEPRSKSIDINELTDFICAEALLKWHLVK